jgi:hypothetical protein
VLGIKRVRDQAADRVSKHGKASKTTPGTSRVNEENERVKQGKVTRGVKTACKKNVKKKKAGERGRKNDYCYVKR